jgi:hypothetical protein
MPKWIKKSLMVMVSVLTLGLVTPEALFASQSNHNKDEAEQAFQSQKPIDEQEIKQEVVSERDQFIDKMVQEAETQAFVKFGPRIKPVIEDEFREMILPNIEKVIADVASKFPDEDLTALAITEMPSGGVSERIFHIVNTKTKKDVIRFHVRRDNPPQEAYRFNFHYHIAEDNYQTHHDLGVINWAKNTPPKWMS